METARRESDWRYLSWILAGLELCRTEAARDFKFDPDRWYVPDMERRERERLIAEAKAEQERKAALTDQARLEALRKAKHAEWGRFMKFVQKK